MHPGVHEAVAQSRPELALRACAEMQPADADVGADWGTAELAAALYTVSTDVTRIKPLLPELSPADRCACMSVWLALPQEHQATYVPTSTLVTLLVGW